MKKEEIQSVADAAKYLLPKFVGMESQFEDMECHEFCAFCHSITGGAIGMRIRNELQLWEEGSSIKKALSKETGLSHPDDISGEILKAVYNLWHENNNLKGARMKYVIFDLDGTIADIELRRKKAMQSGKMNWGIFFDPRNIELDKPNEAVVYLYHQMIMTAGVKTVIFSGRSDITEDATIDWFASHTILVPDILKMRPDTDSTDDRELKTKWLEELLEKEKISKEDILFVVDDRNKVVKMWRNLGITCFQCAEADF